MKLFLAGAREKKIRFDYIKTYLNKAMGKSR